MAGNGPRISNARKSVKIPSSRPDDPGSGKRVQPRSPAKPIVSTSRTGGFGAVAPETLNVSHVPYVKAGVTGQPDPTPLSRPVFKNGVLVGVRKVKRSKK